MKKIILISVTLFTTSCSYFSGPEGMFPATEDDFLNEKVQEDINLPAELFIKSKENHYPVSENLEALENSDVPKPRQIFASSGNSSVQLRRLGELMWIYVETLPSTSWPITKSYWETSDYEVISIDPIIGEMVINFDSLSNLNMKIEHGIRQASSEIFISHLMQDQDEWLRVLGEENLEEEALRRVLDYFASTPSSGGTSLVALNLNYGQKAALVQDDNENSFIELKLEYARAWAAVDRALKEALIQVNDLDRDEGIFYVSFTDGEEKGFFSSFFGGDAFQGEFKISVKEIDETTCRVTITTQQEEAKSFERELLSQINQSLS